MCKNNLMKAKSWVVNWVKKYPIISISIVISVVLFFFVWNILDADSHDSLRANHFTAISGWVSFLGTLLVGVIAIIQTSVYDRKTTETNNYTAQLTNQIKEIIWIFSQPVLEINRAMDIIEYKQSEELSSIALESCLYKDESNYIMFFLSKESYNNLKDCPTFFYRDIECTITNTSDKVINSIRILEFKKREKTQDISYPINLRDYTQGYLKPHDSMQVKFRIFSHKKASMTSNDKILMLNFALQVTDVNGEESKRPFHVFVSSMEEYPDCRKGKLSINLNPSGKQ